MSQLIKVSEWRPERRASVIFIHGLGGHPYDTWRRGRTDVNTDNTFWPRWLAQDIEGLDVYSLAYGASATGWTGQTMPIEDRAANIAELLYTEPNLVTAPLIFICHSLGGLIVKRLLLDLSERKEIRPEAAALFNSVRRITFLATPHTGAGHADLLDKLRLLVWPSALVKAMVADAAALRQINRSYRLLAQERGETLQHRIMFETRNTPLGRIVREGSADPGLNDRDPVGIDADHVKIVKPRDRNTLSYRIVRDFLDDGLEGTAVGVRKIPELPSFDTESTPDYLGGAVWLAAVALIIIAIVFLWPQARSQPSDLQILTALAAIEDAGQRLKVAEQLFARPLNDAEKALVLSARLSVEYRSTIPQTQIERVKRSANTDELRAAIAGMKVQSCSGSYRFKVEAAEIKCADGRPLPVVLSSNIGPPLQKLEALVFHYTAVGDTEAEIRLLTGRGHLGARASYHLVVSREGNLIQLVPFDRQAWHAGRSEWPERGLKGLNAYSIGVGLTNLGRLKKRPDGSFVGGDRTVPPERVTTISSGDKETYWESFTIEQVRTAKSIVRAFRTLQPDIAVLGHSDITAGRRTDPGPAFPLDALKQLK